MSLGESKRLLWDEKNQKFTLVISRMGQSDYPTSPHIRLTKNQISIGCMEISREAWEKLGDRYIKFLTHEEEIVQ